MFLFRCGHPVTVPVTAESRPRSVAGDLDGDDRSAPRASQQSCLNSGPLPTKRFRPASAKSLPWWRLCSRLHRRHSATLDPSAQAYRIAGFLPCIVTEGMGKGCRGHRMDECRGFAANFARILRCLVDVRSRLWACQATIKPTGTIRRQRARATNAALKGAPLVVSL